MKKSIFLFFAAILCAMTANAQWYLRGSFNDWGTSHKFVNNVCEIELPAGTSYEFKVADANWSTGYGYPEITSTSTKTQNGGGNTKFKTGLPGIYKFEISSDAKKLTVTYPEVPAPHDITVRAQVPAHWTNDIYAHVWTSENGSGQDVGPLTKNGDYYEVTKNAGALYVIFKNGSAWSDKNQTVDLCYTEDVCLQINQSGSAKATATVIECGAVAKDITVKAVVPGAWENTITAWVWPTGGEGKEVTPTKDGNWYVVTENCIELNVIFKNGTGWNGNENQTANITGVSENTCYQISALNKDGEGKCTYTVVDCEAAIEPEAKPVDVYTIVGAETLVGTAWDLNNTDNDMTKQGDGSYVLVKENVELATTGTYEYKVVKNRSWDWKGVNGGNNLTLTGVDVDGTYNVTFTLNKELNALTASLELVEAKKVIPECYVAGDESLTGQDWNAKSVLMTYDEATEVYTATLTAVPAGTHNMKVVYGGEWLGFDHLATPAPANVKEGEDKKIQFTLAEAGDVTVTYHATNGIGLTGNFAAPVAHTYTVAGDAALCGEAWNWELASNDMTNNGDGTYTWTKTGVEVKGEMGFKVFVDHASETAYPTENWVIKPENYEGVAVYTVTITFTESSKEITVAMEKTGEATPAVISYVLMGVDGDWTTGIALTADPDNANQYVLKNQPIKSTDALKVVTLTDGAQTAWCGTVDSYTECDYELVDDGYGAKNIVLEDGTYDLYYKVNENNIYISKQEVAPTEITLTEGDNSSALATTGVVTVIVERDFEKEHLYTIALPFTINNAASVFGIGTVVYNFANLAYDKTNEEYILGFTTVGKIEAGKPYLIEPGQDVSSFVAENVTLSGATSISQKVKVNNVEKTATMTAVLSKTTTGGSYWLAENRYLYNGEVDMPALRALFVLPTTPSGMPARARVAFNENVETGVEDIIATDAPVKVIVNGQLIIIRDGEMYNVQGQLVK